MSEGSAWNSARNVLCVRLDNLGDVLMTTPALRALKRGGVDRRITLLASRSGAALAPFLDDVDDVIVYDPPWAKHDHHDANDDARVIHMLKAARFDAAVIFTVYSQSPLPAAFLCRLAGIPKVLAHCRENPYELISDWRPETEPASEIRHEVRRQLDLVASVGALNDQPFMSFRTRRTDRARLRTKLAAHGGIPGPWMVLHAGATAPSRRYPAAYFARALQMLGPRAGTIVLTGDASERGLAAEIAAMAGPVAPTVNVAGELELGEFACLLEEATLLLSNNTGPVHIAAALGTPVVDVYALTNPQHTPWAVPQRVLFKDVPCKYCYRSLCPEGHHACLRGVAPEEVCEAVLELLEETGSVLRAPANMI